MLILVSILINNFKDLLRCPDSAILEETCSYSRQNYRRCKSGSVKKWVTIQ